MEQNSIKHGKVSKKVSINWSIDQVRTD